VVVALASKDEVTPAQAVKAYVERASQMKPAGPHHEHHQEGKSTVELIWWDNSFHGECLFKDTFNEELMKTARRQEEKLGLKSPRVLDFSSSGGNSNNSASHFTTFRINKDHHED